jgi:hypothetical protein
VFAAALLLAGAWALRQRKAVGATSELEHKIDA